MKKLASFVEVDADQSIAIIDGTKKNLSVEAFKPLSSFNSFGQQIQNKRLSPLSQASTDLIGKQTTDEASQSLPYKVVSPKRQSSRSGSSKSSSYNSEFSANTTVTDTTSQPSVTINRETLQQNNILKKKPIESRGYGPQSQRSNYSFPRKKTAPSEGFDLEFNTIYEKRDGKLAC